MESSNEISEDCFYDFLARGDLWYNDSTCDLASQPQKIQPRGGPLGSSNVS